MVRASRQDSVYARPPCAAHATACTVWPIVDALRIGPQADADIPLPDEGAGAPADEASDIDSRNISEASEAGDDGAQSPMGSEGDDGEDLLDNAQACVAK